MSIKREELSRVLKLAEPALASKSAYPAFESFRFDGETVLAYNDQLAISAPFKSELRCCLPGKTLIGLLSASAAPELEVVSCDDAVLKAKLGRSKVELPCIQYSAYEYQGPDLKEASTLEVDDTFVAALERAAVSLGWDALQPWSFGVTLAPSKKSGLRLLSTNNFSMTRASLSGAMAAEAQQLPPQFVEALLKHAKKEKLKRLHMWDVGDWVGAVFDSGVLFLSRTSPQADPGKFTEILKAVRAPQMVDVPKSLEATFQRLSVLITSSVMSERVAKFRVVKERLFVEVESARGTLRDAHKLPGHPDVELKAPPELLARALPFSTTIGFVPERAVCMAGDGFEYVVSGSL